METVVYEHINYFKDFDKSKSFPFVNWPENNKPKGGLWGCRVGASYGWKYLVDECIEGKRAHENPNMKRVEDCTKFNFILKPWAKNYIVSTIDNYNKLPKMIFEGKEVVDYEQCFKDGIDAIEMCAIGDEYEDIQTQEEFDKLDEVFGVYWDCDSIVVLNPDAYEIIS